MPGKVWAIPPCDVQTGKLLPLQLQMAGEVRDESVKNWLRCAFGRLEARKKQTARRALKATLCTTFFFSHEDDEARPPRLNLNQWNNAQGSTALLRRRSELGCALLRVPHRET